MYAECAWRKESTPALDRFGEILELVDASLRLARTCPGDSIYLPDFLYSLVSKDTLWSVLLA
jgi:hypothetical protein